MLATKAHATNFNVQDSSRQSALARGAGKDFQARRKFPRAHLRELADVVANRFGFTGAEVCTASRRDTMAARHIAVITVLEVTRATQSNLASALGLSLDIVKSSKNYGQTVIRNSAVYAEKYGAAKEDILARWPEYRSEA